MRNYVQAGEVITAIAPAGGIAAGQGLLVGAREFGVATHAAAHNAEVELITRGVVTMAKTSALAITRGALVFWDATNRVVNVTTSGQVAVGVAHTSAVDPSPTVQVRLFGVTLPGT